MVNIPNTFSAGTVIESSKVNTNFSTLGDNILDTFTFTIPGTLSVGANTPPALIVHNTLTIIKAYAYVKTAPTDADIIIDINIGGTSIWNVTPANRLTIAAGAQIGTQINFDTTSLSDENVITVDIDQVGSTIAGADLTIELKTT